MPNNAEKMGCQYSNTNWAYLTEEAAQFIADKGITEYTPLMHVRDKKTGKIFYNVNIAAFLYGTLALSRYLFVQETREFF